MTPKNIHGVCPSVEGNDTAKRTRIQVFESSMGRREMKMDERESVGQRMRRVGRFGENVEKMKVGTCCFDHRQCARDDVFGV